ncbi:MAG TPA: GNAT family N-acetyltransferase [Longimicrobiales bacterium]|nr:GNAT family N-acetyltransferase [Longimicrobiales bacterium]
MSQRLDEDDVLGLDIVLDLEPAASDVRSVAEGLLEAAENYLATGRARRPFSVFVRSPDGALVGGVNARLAYGDLHIDQLWCARVIRGNGFATRLLERAEVFGRENGASAALLNTFDPELVRFYERRGYRTIGEVAGLAAGQPVYFLRKQL